jgi:hypothetical protein
MTNDQAPMTNGKSLGTMSFIGHWDLVIGHSEKISHSEKKLR